jgi:hypothetical protein
VRSPEPELVDNLSIQGVKIAELNLRDQPQAFYTRYGDVFAMICLAFTLLLWAVWGIRAIRHRRPQ